MRACGRGSAALDSRNTSNNCGPVSHSHVRTLSPHKWRSGAGVVIKSRSLASSPVWKSTSELGFAIELPQRRVDGVGRLKFDFHTGYRDITALETKVY